MNPEQPIKKGENDDQKTTDDTKVSKQDPQQKGKLETKEFECGSVATSAPDGTESEQTRFGREATAPDCK